MCNAWLDSTVLNSCLRPSMGKLLQTLMRVTSADCSITADESASAVPAWALVNTNIPNCTVF